MNLQIGSLISFAYQSPRSHDRYPEVLVLHPSWRFYPNRSGGKALMHGLNFNYLTDDEINMIRMIVDPGFQLKYFQNMERKNPGIAQQFDRIIANAGNANITSPHDFYLKVVKPFIMPKRYDPYRLYDPTQMQNTRILQTPRQFTGENKVSMFGNTQPRGSGKTEQQVISDLAAKKATEEQTGVKQLTPTEERFMRQLQGNALNLFNRYKMKFQAARGPAMDNRLPNRTPNFAKNNNQPDLGQHPGQSPRLPSFMDNDED
jgi:hypothetical protein